MYKEIKKLKLNREIETHTPRSAYGNATDCSNSKAHNNIQTKHIQRRGSNVYDRN